MSWILLKIKFESRIKSLSIWIKDFLTVKAIYIQLFVCPIKCALIRWFSLWVTICKQHNDAIRELFICVMTIHFSLRITTISNIRITFQRTVHISIELHITAFFDFVIFIAALISVLRVKWQILWQENLSKYATIAIQINWNNKTRSRSFGTSCLNKVFKGNGQDCSAVHDKIPSPSQSQDASYWLQRKNHASIDVLSINS